MKYIWEALPHGEVVNVDKKGNKTCACCNAKLPKDWRDKDPKLVIKIGNVSENEKQTFKVNRVGYNKFKLNKATQYHIRSMSVWEWKIKRFIESVFYLFSEGDKIK